MSDDFPSDINFSSGENWVVVIHTRQYSGNFERELAGYVFGACDDDRGHGATEAAEFEDAAEEDPRLTAIMEKVTSQFHFEYGDVSNTIWPTPGRTNNGVGGHSDVTDDNPFVCEVYESAAVFFSEALTEEELTICEARAKEFCANYFDSWSKTGLTFIGIEQFCVEVEIKRKVTRK